MAQNNRKLQDSPIMVLNIDLLFTCVKIPSSLNYNFPCVPQTGTAGIHYGRVWRVARELPGIIATSCLLPFLLSFEMTPTCLSDVLQLCDNQTYFPPFITESSLSHTPHPLIPLTHLPPICLPCLFLSLLGKVDNIFFHIPCSCCFFSLFVVFLSSPAPLTLCFLLSFLPFSLSHFVGQDYSAGQIRVSCDTRWLCFQV